LTDQDVSRVNVQVAIADRSRQLIEVPRRRPADDLSAAVVLRAVAGIPEDGLHPNTFDEPVVIRWERHPLECAAVPRVLANEGVQRTTFIADEKDRRRPELG
jgi:hypothetical protein